jgi:hypothetical protein
MSFLTFAEVKSLYPAAAQVLKSEADFAPIQSAVDDFISDHTGVAIPDSGSAPGWAKTPAAMLVYRFLIMRNSAPTQESLQDSLASYNDAIEILDKHIDKNSKPLFEAVEVKERYLW